VKPKARGFTLLELMVVIGLLLMLSVIGLGNYRDFKINQSLTNAASQLALDLQYARELAAKYEDTVYIDLYSNDNASFYTIRPRQSYTAYTAKTVDLNLEFDGARISLNGYSMPQTLKIIQGGYYALVGGAETPTAFTIKITKPGYARLRTLNIETSGQVSALEW
jgi:prepilin-type N-terminal cleavage/methylation domain-containing protein